MPPKKRLVVTQTRVVIVDPMANMRLKRVNTVVFRAYARAIQPKSAILRRTAQLAKTVARANTARSTERSSNRIASTAAKTALAKRRRS